MNSPNQRARKITRKNSSLPRNTKIWVLAPSLESGDSSIDYYYDFSQSKEEYARVFHKLGLPWQWVDVTEQNYKTVIEQLIIDSSGSFPIILNLCDGDGMNNIPGLSVLKFLKKKNVVFTGSDEFFYKATTSKIPMKRLFDSKGVATPEWVSLSGNDHPADVFKKLGSPVIIKPAISGGSMGVGIRSVVENEASFSEQLELVIKGYHGWDLASGGIFAERFINGPEFTTLIVGSSDNPAQCHVYTPVERVFHHALPDMEKFLSFDRLWEIYEDEKPIGEDEHLYEYQHPAPDLIEAISNISLDAYCAVKGQGYGRIDIRMDKETGKLYVLEVNAQCGLSEDEDFTSIGAIIRLSGIPYADLILQILKTSVQRSQILKPATRKLVPVKTAV